MPYLERQRRGKGSEKTSNSRLTLDVDPEDVPSTADDQSSESDVESIEPALGREHYKSVGTSNLRSRVPVNLGPQYDSSQVKRSDIDLSNTFEGGPSSQSSSGKISNEEQLDLVGEDDFDVGASSDDDDDIFDQQSNDQSPSQGDTSSTSVSEAESDTIAINGRTHIEDRAELRRALNDGQRTTAASIAQAAQHDVEKGHAVKLQREAYDSLMSTRMRMQHAVIAMNSMALLIRSSDTEESASELAEQAALRLWNNLEDLRHAMTDAHQPSKKLRFQAKTNTPSTKMWSHMQSREDESRKARRSVLNKWSARTRGVTARSESGRIDQSSRQQTVIDRIDSELTDTSRLVERTQVPRSCAPDHYKKGISMSSDIFDDADFYGLLLKEILEQRNIEAASHVQTDQTSQEWKAIRSSKTKKQVDTKASKGRKMRFTTIEKLQNFMAPEDRSTWNERQKDELFGSLLGKQFALGEVDERTVEDELDVGEEALRLFRS